MIIFPRRNNTKLVHWSGIHLVQRGEDEAGPQPAQAPLALPNVTVHLSVYKSHIAV